MINFVKMTTCEFFLLLLQAISEKHLLLHLHPDEAEHEAGHDWESTESCSLKLLLVYDIWKIRAAPPTSIMKIASRRK